MKKILAIALCAVATSSFAAKSIYTCAGDNGNVFKKQYPQGCAISLETGTWGQATQVAESTELTLFPGLSCKDAKFKTTDGKHFNGTVFGGSYKDDLICDFKAIKGPDMLFHLKPAGKPSNCVPDYSKNTMTCDES